MAAGQAAHPVAGGNVTTPVATAVAPGCTTTPPEPSCHRQPKLSPQGSAGQSACAWTPIRLPDDKHERLKSLA